MRGSFVWSSDCSPIVAAAATAVAVTATVYRVLFYRRMFCVSVELDLDSNCNLPPWVLYQHYAYQ
jgi:hypothetical protein